jgi:formylmethanofuran:tetrahydromethanopterin formyltransferase
MVDIYFERAAGDAGHWFTFWPLGELRMFRDREAAALFATRHGLNAVFKEDAAVTDWDVGLAAGTDVPEPGRIDYRFLGVTGEEES